MSRNARSLTLGFLGASAFALCATTARAQERRYVDTVPNAYRDIATIGTSIGLSGDERGQFVSIGFNFTFFDQTFATVSATTNGYLCFDGAVNPVNDHIPSTFPPNGLIAPFWTDLDMRPNPNATVLVWRGGEVGKRAFVIQWSGIALKSDPASNLNFQVVLFEGTNEIQFLYGSMKNGDGTTGGPASGSTATIGVKSGDGTRGVEVSFNQVGAVSRGYAFSANAYAVPEGRKLGDLNGDGVVNVLDQSRLAEVGNPLYQPFSALELLMADIAPLASPTAVCGDGKVNIVDRDLMSQVIVKRVKLGPYLAGGTPSDLVRGQSLTLTGSNFDTSAAGNNTVILAGAGGVPVFVPAESVNATGSRLTVTVPQTAVAGAVFVLAGNKLSNPRLANVSGVPSILGVAPNPGVQGEPLTLSGVQFPATASDMTVTIAGLQASVVSLVKGANPDQRDTVTVTVPTGFAPGNVPVVVSYVSTGSKSEPFTTSVGQRPIAVITSPGDGTLLASGPIPVTGTASSPNFVSYTLAVAPLAGGTFATVGSSTTAVTSGALGTYDPTIYLNGYYQLKLTVTDTLGITATDTKTFSIQGNFKTGQFTLRFLDLELSSNGIAIQVVREYDSRDKFPRDFGVGWKQKWVTVDLQKDANHNVIVNNPYSTTVEYAFTPKQINPLDPRFFTAQFTPTDPAEASKIDFETPELVDPGNHVLAVDGVGNYFWFPEGIPFDPTVYDVTEVDGTVLRIDGGPVAPGLLQIIRPTGQTLTITHYGIKDSNGRGVVFTRDAFDRISAVTDANRNSQQYFYDLTGNLVKQVDALGFPTTFVYDLNHYMTDYKDSRGNDVTRCNYDNYGRLLSTVDPFGRTLIFAHDLAARSDVTYDRSGRPTTTEYDAKGRVTKIVGPDGLFEQYTLNDKNDILTRRDRAGNVWTNEFDANGFKTAAIDPAHNRTEYTYGAFGKILSVKDPDGGVARFTYDARGNLLTAQDPAGGVVTRTHDTKGNLLTVKDERGKVTTYTYDPNSGNLQGVSLPTGEVLAIAADANGNVIRETKSAPGVNGGPPILATTLYAYDAANHRTNVTRPDGTQVAYRFGAGGKLVERTDSGGRHETYSYDALGRPLQRIGDDGRAETSEYDANGNTVALTDLHGRRTASVDPMGQPLTVTFADGTTLKAEYDPTGLVTARVDAQGLRWTKTYDGAGRLLTETDPAGAQITYGYNGRGQVTSKLDADGHTTTYAFDGAGRLLKTTFPDGTSETLVRDLSGNVTQRTDIFGRVTQFVYGAYDEQSQITLSNGFYSYTRDSLGRVVQQTDPNTHATSFSYDPTTGKRIGVTLPLGQQSQATWDGNHPTQTVDFDGKITQFQYDGRQKLTFRAFPEGTGERITYNALGDRVELVEDVRGQTRVTHDTQGRLQKRIEPDGRSLAFAYDASGNVQQILSAAGAMAVGHDAHGRVTAVADVQTQTTTFAYTPGGVLKTIQRPNGIKTDVTTDVMGRLKTLTHSNASGTIASYAYDYDQYGQRSKVTEGTGRTVGYTYDPLGRLATETATVASVTTQVAYTYDAAGNRLTKTTTRPGGAVETVTYGYDANDRLLAESVTDTQLGASSVNYVWDASGHLLERDSASQVSTFGYDGIGRLTSAVVTHGAQQDQVLYRYDYFNNLVQTVRNGVATNHLVDANRPVSQTAVDTDASGNVVASYAYGNWPISVTTAAGAFYFLADGQASTRVVADASGNVVATFDYDAFGVPSASSGNTSVTDVLYTGERVDPTTGLVFLRSRWLDPRSGRFTTRDTFEGTPFDPPTTHAYVYALGNPVTRIDPPGTDSCDLQCMFNIDVPNALAGLGGGDADARTIPTTLSNVLSELNVFVPDAFDLLHNDKDLATAFALVGAALDKSSGGNKALLTASNVPSRATSAYLFGTKVVGRMGSDVMLAISRPPGTASDTPANRLLADGIATGLYISYQPQPKFETPGVAQLPIYQDVMGYLAQLGNGINTICTFTYQLDGNGNQVGYNYPHIAFTVAATGVRWNLMFANPTVPGASEIDRIVKNDPKAIAIELNDDDTIDDFKQALRSGGDFGSPAPFILSFANAVIPPNTFPTILKEAIPQRNKPAGLSASTVTVGAGVLAHSGEFMLDRSDLKVPGRGLDFEIHRTYRSGLIYPETTTLHTNFHLGHNWSFAHDHRVGNSGSGVLVDLDPMGRASDAYRSYMAGTSSPGYLDPPGRFSSVAQTVIRYRWLPTGAPAPVLMAERGYLSRASNGVLEGYNAAGWIVWQQDRQGNTIEHLRDENHLLRQTYDTLGRLYTYQYVQLQGHSLITQITDVAGNRSLRYAYDASTLDLLSATSAANRTESYAYSKGFDNPALNHNMTQVFFPENPGVAAITNVYKNTDPGSIDFDSVISQTYGGTTQALGADGTTTQTVAAGGTYQLQYADVNILALSNDTNTIATRSQITDRRGNTAKYEFNRSGNPINVYDETSALTQHFYDLDGLRRLTIFPNGHREYLGYDSNNPISAQRMNLVYQAQFPAPGDPSPAIVTEFDYEPLFGQLRRVSDTEAFRPVTAPPPDGIDARVWLTPSSDFDRFTNWNSFDYEEGGPPGVPIGLALHFGYKWKNITDYRTFAQLQTVTAPPVEPGLPLQVSYIGVGALPSRWQLAFNKGDLNFDGVKGVTSQLNDPIFGLESLGVQLAGPNGTPITTLLDYSSPSCRGLMVKTAGHIATLNGVQQPSETIFQYNRAGQITKKVEALGVVATSVYYPDGTPYDPVTGAQAGLMKQTISDDAAFPGVPRLASQFPIGASVTMEYDAYGNVRKVTDPIGCVTESVYDADGLMVERRRGTNDPTLTYHTLYTNDGNRRLTRVRVEDKGSLNPIPDGYTEQRIAYDICGSPIEEGKKLLSGGAIQWLVTKHTYDAEQNRTATILPEANQTTWEYDVRRLVSVEHRGAGSADEAITRYDYDKNRNLIAVTLPLRADVGDRKIQYVFDAFNRPMDIVSPDGTVVRRLYDTVGNLETIQKFGIVGGVTPTGNDQSRNVLLESTMLVRDERRRVVQEQHQLFGPSVPSATATFTSLYDALDRVVKKTDPEGRNVQFVVDGLGRVFQTTDDAGNQISDTFDADGNLLTRTEHEVSTVVAAQDFTTTHAYDTLSRVTETKDSAGQKTTFAYDSRDNVVRAFDALGAPDGQGSNAPGNPMNYLFDSLGRLIETQDELHVGGTGAGAIDTVNSYSPSGLVRLRTEYDKNSRRTAMVDDSGDRTTYAFDALDRVTNEIYADATRTQFFYNTDDTVKSVKDPNGTTTSRFFDSANRLITVNVTPGAGVVGVLHEEYQYDGLARLTHCLNDSGSDVIDRTYDSFSRLLTEKQAGKTLTSTWSLNGKRLSLTYPGGRAFTYAYDLIDRPTGISEKQGAVSTSIATSDYIGTGRPVRRTLGNGTVLNLADSPTAPTTAAGYDSARRVVALKHHKPSGGNAFVNRAYGYDRTDRRAFEQRNEDGGLTDLYSRDSLHRITDVTYDQGGNTRRTNALVHYALDGVGNRRQVQDTTPGGVPSTVSYTVNSLNEYTVVGTTARTYSAAGELTTDGQFKYAYDYRHRLTTVSMLVDGSAVAAYTYDCQNRRTSKTLFDPVTHAVSWFQRYFYDGGREVEEQDSTQVTLVTYVHGSLHMDDAIQIQRTAGHPLGAAVLYLHEDARANVTAVSDATGTVVEQRIYDDYGVAYDPATKQTVTSSPVGNPFGFQSRYFDPETGFYQFRDRFFDPATGRFLTRDPVLDSRNLGNQYSFTGNDPASLVDPSGDFAFLLLMAVTAGFGNGFTNSVQSDLDAHRKIDVGRAMNEGFLGALMGAQFGANMVMFGFGGQIAMIVQLGIAAGNAYLDLKEGIKTGNWAMAKGGLIAFAHIATALIPGPVSTLLDMGLDVMQGNVIGAISAGVQQLGGGELGQLAGSFAEGATNDMFGGEEFSNCFLKGTLVETERGRVAIEDVRIGDRVWSSSDKGDGSVRELRGVKRLFRNVTSEVAYVTVGVAEDEAGWQARSREARRGARSGIAEEGGGESADEPPSRQTICCTPRHPWFVKAKQWVLAGQLSADDRLVSLRGETVAILSAEIRAEVAETFNFEVDGWHSYYVSESAGAPAVWVHNDSTEETFYHYTDAKGFKAISSQKNPTFKASQPPGGHPVGAYFTRHDPTTAGLASRLGVPNRKLDYVFEVKLAKGALTSLRGSRGQKDSLFHKTDLAVSSANVRYAGPTSNWAPPSTPPQGEVKARPPRKRR